MLILFCIILLKMIQQIFIYKHVILHLLSLFSGNKNLLYCPFHKQHLKDVLTDLRYPLSMDNKMKTIYNCE